MLVKSVFHFLLNLSESWSEDFQDNGCVRFVMEGGGGEVEAARYVGLTTLPPSRVDCLGILKASNVWSPRGLSRPVQGQFYVSREKQEHTEVSQSGLDRDNE